jgi:FkbM family methyltransferase
MTSSNLKQRISTVVNHLLHPFNLKVSSLSQIEKLHAKLEKLQKKELAHQVNYNNFWSWLRQEYDINAVIDIGANNGDFAAFLANFFSPKVIYAFEPLKSCLPALEATQQSIQNLKVFNLALSDNSGQATFYENSYAPSSSLLHVSDYSKDEFPQTKGETQITVEVAKLDDILDGESVPKDILIKIDCQGTEDLVIAGGKKIFSLAKCVLIEVSFVPMYEKQPLFEDIHQILAGLGYRFAGIKNQISSVKNGQPLFAHCLYVR